MENELRVQEAVYQTTPLRHDREKSTVYGIKVVSWGDTITGLRTYESSCGIDVNKFHNSKSNIDHQPDPNGAVYGVRFGRVFNPRVGTDGIYADYRYNPEHKHARDFAWWVDNDPTAIGFSIDAMSKIERRSNGKIGIVGFKKVNSVDVVGDPASTKGVFESKMNQEPAAPTVDESGQSTEVDLDIEGEGDSPDEMQGTGADEELGNLASKLFLAGDSLDKEKVCRVLRSLADLVEDMEGDGESEEQSYEDEGDKTPKEEDEKMVQESVITELQEKVAKLETELNEYRTQESRRTEYETKKVAMRAKCKEMKLEDKHVSDLFIDNLASQEDDKTVVRMIEDRISLTKTNTSVGVNHVLPISVGATGGKMNKDEMKNFLKGVK